MNEGIQEIRRRHRERYHGKRYHWTVPSDGKVEVGVVCGLGGVWFTGYITESGATRRVKSKALPVMMTAEAAQMYCDQWAKLKKLEEVRD